MSFTTYQPNRPVTAKRARTLRNAMTEPEKRLWWAFRNRFPDYKFRRQFVIGQFVADFCCVKARLVVEVDGNQHGTDEARERDAQRTELIETQHFRGVRFSNEDVMKSIDSVLDTVFAALIKQFPEMGQAEGPPPLTPPRKGEGKPHG